MRTRLIKKAAYCLTVSSLVVGPFVSSATIAKPSQTAPATILTVNPKDNNPVLVRNTTAKTDPSPTASATKEQDKKTMGRCWKRLMTMVREVSHAHRNKKSNP